jgi:hypothetical protein
LKSQILLFGFFYEVCLPLCLFTTNIICMKNILVITIAAFMLLFNFAKAQFGFVKKADIETFKDTRLIVVLYLDSSYNAAITKAVQQYWTFNSGFEFVYDSSSEIKKYNKPEFSFLMFARSKKSTKMKAKLGSSEDDFNGLLITKKYKKRAKLDEVIANAYCSNAIDTPDWYPELMRGVQMLNNYFDFAIQASTDKEISPAAMMPSYPGDFNELDGKKLLIEERMLLMKGKEDAASLYGNEVEEVDRDEIYKAIVNQDPEVAYVFHVFNEKFCDKIFVSAAGSKVMHFDSGTFEKCKCEAKDLKAIKMRIDKAAKGN